MRLTLIIAGIPQYTQAHYNLALAEYRTGNLVAAQDEALAALKLNNADAKGLFEIAARDTTDPVLKTLCRQIIAQIG